MIQNINEKILRKLDLIKKEKPYHYYAYKTINCDMKFSVYLHENCIELYMTWKPLEKKYYNYNDTSPSLCIVYQNNEITSCLISMNFMELFEKIKKTSNNDCVYKFYYFDLCIKDNHEIYFEILKNIKQMVKRYLIVKNKLCKFK